MTTERAEVSSTSSERAMHAMLEKHVMMNRPFEDDEDAKPLAPSTNATDDDPAGTSTFVALQIPSYGYQYYVKNITGQTIRPSRRVNFIWTDITGSKPPVPGKTRIPRGVRSCKKTTISCTIRASSWRSADLLRWLFITGYIDAQLERPLGKLRDLGIVDVHVKSASTSTSSLPQLDTSQVSNAVHQVQSGRPASIVSSKKSFITARSRFSLGSTSSKYSNSTFYSLAARVETVREDEPPNPELSVPLVEIHTDYYTTLRQQEIIQPFDRELNWSGKGQHVTFAPHEVVPLSFISHLGSSNTAIVERVLCRRIQLARKTMRCSRKWKVSDAMGEVRHLQRLRHFHIVQLVGTYLERRNFSILMYPVADMHLARFLEDANDLSLTESDAHRRFLGIALGCLASAVGYIHQKTTKHMDIKPQNILVRQVKSDQQPEWQLYLADFGLSRSFASQDHSQTDGPTARSPRYCSPEVYDETPRGRPSDIFSLGCVFLEILCVMGCLDLQGLADARQGDEHDESFHANLESVTEWIRTKLFRVSSDLVHKPIILLVIRMLCREPSGRPTAADIRKCLEEYRGRSPEEDCCSRPPEPYTVYQPAGNPK